MKTIKVFLALAILVAIVMLYMHAHAGYPMISPIANQYIPMNSSTDTLRFNVSDDVTSTNDLVLSFRSNNTQLVPNDDDNVIIGGRGSDRTVKVVPLPGRSGAATIIITVTDTDGETNTEDFDVEVRPPPR